MKKITKKLIALGLVAVMGVATFVGCGNSGASDGGNGGGANSGGSSDGQVTVKFVHKYPEANRMELFEEIVADFEKANPNIKIEMTAYGDEEIKDKIRVLLGSADAPDVYFTWAGERIIQYVRSGNGLDITQYVDGDADWKGSFNPAMLEACNTDGSYWAIPWCYSSKEFVYNKAVFEEAGITSVPTTWSEFLDACEKIKAIGKTPIAVGNQYSWVICHYLTTMNAKLVPADTMEKNYSMEELDYTDPGYAQALDMLRELYDKGYINADVNSMTWESSQALVQEGQAGMIYEEVQDFYYYVDTMGDNWGYFDFPEIEGAAGETGLITGGPDVFMVNADTKVPEEAIAFLKYLTSDEVQAKMAYRLAFMPVTGVELDSEQMYPQTIEVIEKNMNAPGISYWLDCVLNQTVSDTYLDGCQTIFMDQTGASIMEEVSATSHEVADE